MSDDSGEKDAGLSFAYVLLTALGLYLVPASISRIRALLSSSGSATKDSLSSTSAGEAADALTDSCLALDRAKQAYLKRREKVRKVNRTERWWSRVWLVVFILAWIVFLLTLLYINSLEPEEFDDPFDALGVSHTATTREIKKAYRQLSLKWHPDKNPGDAAAEATFVQLTRAYKALTDDTARENYEKYGNIDGPRKVTFGFAGGMMEQRQFVIIYVLVLFVGVPLWLYRAKKAKGMHEQTAQTFDFLVGVLQPKYPLEVSQSMDTSSIKTLLIALTYAREFYEAFEKKGIFNAEKNEIVNLGMWLSIKNEDFPRLHIGDKLKKELKKKTTVPGRYRELPANQQQQDEAKRGGSKKRKGEDRQATTQKEPYHIVENMYLIKTFTLLNAHLERARFHKRLPSILEDDLEFVLEKLPEFFKVLTDYSMPGRPQRPPWCVGTTLRCLYMSQNIVQARYPRRSSEIPVKGGLTLTKIEQSTLNQIPHLTSAHINYCLKAKPPIDTVHKFFAADQEVLRSRVQDLTEGEWQDIQWFGQKHFPFIRVDVDVRLHGDSKIAKTAVQLEAGDTIDVTVKLTRQTFEKGVAYAMTRKDPVNINHKALVAAKADDFAQSAAQAVASFKKGGGGARGGGGKKRGGGRKGGKRRGGGGIGGGSGRGGGGGSDEPPVAAEANEQDGAEMETVVNAKEDEGSTETMEKEEAGEEKKQDEEEREEGEEEEEFEDEKFVPKERKRNEADGKKFPVHCPHYPFTKNEEYTALLFDTSMARLLCQRTCVKVFYEDTETGEFSNEIKFTTALPAAQCYHCGALFDIDQRERYLRHHMMAHRPQGHPSQDVFECDDSIMCFASEKSKTEYLRSAKHSKFAEYKWAVGVVCDSYIGADVFEDVTIRATKGDTLKPLGVVDDFQEEDGFEEEDGAAGPGDNYEDGSAEELAFSDESEPESESEAESD